MSNTFSRRHFLRYLVTGTVAGFASSLLVAQSGSFGINDAAFGFGVNTDGKPRYADFLRIISDDRFNVYPIIEYDMSYRADKVNILLRHDVDSDNGYGFAKLDYAVGIRSSFYLRLHSLEYELGDVEKFYQKLESNGYEIGYHYEVMDRCSTVSVNECALKLFKQELAQLRQYFNVRSVCPHGGTWNYLLDKDAQWASLSQECGVISAYRIPFSRKVDYYYLSDSSQAFAARKLEYFKTELENKKPGDIVQILVHPYLPRWEYEVYANASPPSIPQGSISETPNPSFLAVLSISALAMLYGASKRRGQFANSA